MSIVEENKILFKKKVEHIYSIFSKIIKMQIIRNKIKLYANKLNISHEKVSLVILALIELIAGLTLFLNLDSIILNPIILFLIPSLMNSRGAVYGVFILRLIKFLYLGFVKPNLKDKLIKINIYTTLLVANLISVMLAIIAYFLEVIFFKTEINFLSLLTVSLTTSFLSFFLILFPVSFLLFYYFNKGKAIEYVGAPYITAISDITVVLIFFLVLPISFILLFQIAILIIFFLITFLIFFKKLFDKIFIKESLSVISLTSSFSGIGGFLYSRMINFNLIQNLIIALPGYNALLGGLGGILASRISVLLHLGKSSSFINYVYDLRIAYVSFFSGIFLISFIAGFLGIAIVLIASFLMVFLISFFAFYLSNLTFKKGLDPDNVIFPIISTLGDLFGPASIVLIFLLFLL